MEKSGLSLTLPLNLASASSYDYNDHNSHIGERNMSSHQWSIAEAKAKFSEVIDQAESQGPQTITRHGRTAAVIVAADEWERKARRIGNLAEFFAASPLRNSGAKIRRLAGRARKPKL